MTESNGTDARRSANAESPSADTGEHDSDEARLQLAKEAERLRYVALATHDAIYDWDMRQGMTYCNERFKELFELPPTTKTTEPWWKDRIHPDDYQRIVGSAIAAFRAQSPTWSQEYRLRRLDGTYGIVNDRAYVLYGADRKPLRLIGAIADETDRRKTEQSLRDAQAWLVSAMQAGGLATWIWDVPANIVYWDDASYRLWGRRPQEVSPLTMEKVSSFVHPDDVERITGVLTHFYRTGADTPIEFRTIRPDGVLQWLFSTGQIERDSTGRPLRAGGVYIDITDRKRIEEAQLRSQKMEALGTLAGGIAHDFNNILLAIAGNTKLAMNDLQTVMPAEHSVQRNLLEIEKAAARAADLVKRILTFSRQEETPREAQQLQPLIEDALRLLRPTLRATIDIRTALDAAAAPVASEPIQIQQVVMNLVTNAAHAIGDKPGVIDIRLSDCKLHEACLLASGSLKPGQYVCLTVSDSGGGIDPAVIDRIFEPFFTTKPVGQGTGLGLAVVHGIVRTHGGAIGVESDANRGAVFRVYLPAASGDVKQAEVEAPPVPRSRGAHVLYVDDEEALVHLISRVLERQGYRVTGCVDPEQALRELSAGPQNFDAVVTDLSMHGMNGFDLTKEIRAIRPDLPVLLTSGYLRSEDRELAAQSGIRELILKPNTVEELGRAIDRALARLP